MHRAHQIREAEMMNASPSPASHQALGSSTFLSLVVKRRFVIPLCAVAAVGIGPSTTRYSPFSSLTIALRQVRSSPRLRLS
jgi:hypothetical protein